MAKLWQKVLIPLGFIVVLFIQHGIATTTTIGNSTIVWDQAPLESVWSSQGTYLPDSYEVQLHPNYSLLEHSNTIKYDMAPYISKTWIELEEFRNISNVVYISKNTNETLLSAIRSDSNVDWVEIIPTVYFGIPSVPEMEKYYETHPYHKGYRAPLVGERQPAFLFKDGAYIVHLAAGVSMEQHWKHFPWGLGEWQKKPPQVKIISNDNEKIVYRADLNHKLLNSIRSAEAVEYIEMEPAKVPGEAEAESTDNS